MFFNYIHSKYISLHDKLRSLLEQYDLRETHFLSVVRSKDLELQLYDAKLEQQRQLTEQETTKVRADAGSQLCLSSVNRNTDLCIHVVGDVLEKSSQYPNKDRNRASQATWHLC